MELRINCRECGNVLEGFTCVKQDSEWKGSFVVVCYNPDCRTPDGGLLPIVDFHCQRCGKDMDPRILETHHVTSEYRWEFGIHR